MTASDAAQGSTEKQKSNLVSGNERLLGEAFPSLFLRSELLNVDSKTPGTLFLEGVYEGAISRPVQAIKQLADKNSKVASDAAKPSDLYASGAKAPVPDSGYSTAGQIVGSLAPFVALSVITKSAGNRVFGKLEETTLRRTVAEQAVSGFALGSLLTPSELKPGESLLDARLKSGFKDATVFGSMALTGGYLSRIMPGAASELNSTIGSTVTRRVAIGAGSGAVGGFLDAEIRTGGTASGGELLASMAGYAAFGGLMEGGNVLAKRYLAASSARDSHSALGEAQNRENMQLSAARLATQDANTFVINSFGGWYDKLLKAVRTAPQGQTIIVTEEAWLKEAQLMLRRSNRPDINVIMAKPVNEGAAALPDGNAVASRRESGAESTKKTADLATAKTGEVRPAVMDKAALAKAIEGEVLKSGRDPAEALMEALKKNRVLMVGEYHTPENPHRDLGSELIASWQKAGATHLAIEHSSTHKGKIFKPDGEVRTEQFTTFMNQHEYMRLLRNARKSGMEVVPVDSSDKTLAPILAKLEPKLKGLDIPAQNEARTAATLTQRNIDMAENILKILDANPNNKVVFWVGNYHLNMTQMPGEGPQVAKLLRDRKVSVATFASQHDGYWSSEPMRNIYVPPQAYAVPMKDAPILGQQTMQNKNEAGADRLFFNQYDYLIMYPKKGYSYD